MAKTPSLSPAAARVIDGRVDDLFDNLLTRLLGHGFTGRHLHIGFHRDLSLPGIFEAGTTGEGGRVDQMLLTGVADIARDYIGKHREEAKAKTKHAIGALLQDLHHGKIDADEFQNHTESELHRLWDSIRSAVERVVETENEHASTMGIKDGIEQINTSLGVEDPVVCFIPVKDDNLCDECRRLHLLPDGLTPRVWRSSEVEAGYHKKGVDRPSWNRLHPHCRCALATVLPGFGFDEGGRVTWIGQDHDELAYQRSYKRPPRGETPRLKRIGKSEQPAGEALEKMARPAKLPSSKDLLPYVGDGECYLAAESVNRKFPALASKAGFFVRADGHPADHAWTQGADGTVYDTTYSQFNPKVKVGIFKAGTAEWKRYRSYDEHHPLRDPKSCLLRAIGRDEPCEAPGCDWRGTTKKSEPGLGLPLLKYDVKYQDLSAALKQYGWEEARHTGHIQWKHPQIPGRPVPIKQDHASGSQPIDDEMLRSKYLKQAGLLIDRTGSIVPSARHPYAEHYQKLGHEVPGFRGPQQQRTWHPERAPEGVRHVPVDDLEAGPFEEWQAGMHTANLNQGKGHLVPHVTAMDLGDGRLTVDRGSEVIEAARRSGMTHVPVLVQS